MNAFFSSDAATAWHIIGFAVDLGLKATIALMAALAVTWIARRRSAALRHRIWFLTYCGLLLLPVLPLALPQWQIPLPFAFDRFQAGVSHSLPMPSQNVWAIEPATQNHPGSQPDPTFDAPSQMNDLSEAGTLREAGRGRAAETSGPRSSSIATSPSAMPPMLATAVPQPKPSPDSFARFVLGALLFVWAAGAAVSSCEVLVGRRRGRQLLKSAEPVRDPLWRKPLEELCHNLRVTSGVRLLVSAQAIVPMATGVVHPAVLLPRETEKWPATLRRHVLIHELAHVKRRDVLQHLICRLAISLYWFHPLAWYGAGRMRLEREIACDDFVLMAGEHPCDYASELVAIARQIHGVATPWVVCMASGSTLEARVRAMLDRARSHGPLGVGAARSLLIVALAAIALLAAVEPGTSSVRQQTPARANVADPHVGDRHGSKKDADASAKPLLSKEISGDLLTVRGQVLTPAGRPAAGATVQVGRAYDPRFAPPGPSPSTQSGLDGKFELTFSPSMRDRMFGAAWKNLPIMARLPGFGPQWMRWSDIDAAKPLVLKLERDLPIRGRVLDLQGSPIAGVRVRVMYLEKPADGNLDSMFASMQADSSGFSRKRSPANMLFCPADSNLFATTDADGRFSLTGLGAERTAVLEFQGDTITYSRGMVATRPTVPHVPPIGSERLQLLGAEFTFAPPPTRPIVGTVRDAATGKPLTGIRVQNHDLLWSFYKMNALRTETDANGRYELRGMPEGQGNTIFFRPNDDQPYLMREAQVLPARTGLRPVTIDVELHRGVWIRGRVTDKRSGKPVAGAIVSYAPLLTNPFTFPLPEFDRSNGRQRMDYELHYLTDADGNFRLPGLPGRGLVGVNAFGRNFLSGVGAAEVHVPIKNGSYETYHGAYFVPNDENAIKEVDPAADAQEATCDFVLAPAESVRLTLLDPDGRPIHGCWGLNITRGVGSNGSEIGMDSTSDILGLAPDETRRVWILHRERKLGKYFELKPGNRPREMTVKLEPCATLTGRLVDTDGGGLEGLLVDASPIGIGPGMIKSVRSEADGKFAFPYAPAGCDYSLTVGKPWENGAVRRLHKIDRIHVETAKPIDLGELTIKQEKRTASIQNQPATRLTSGEIKTAETLKGPEAAASERNLQTPRDPKHAEPVTHKNPLRLSGRVLDPDGKPVAGAAVRIHAILGQAINRTHRSALLASVTTDALGRYEHTLDRSRIPVFDGAKYPSIRGVATKPGFGLALKWFDLRDSAKAVEFQLVPDEPVRGRVLNLEGSPIVGARVEVVTFQRNTEMMTLLQKMEAAHAFGPYQLTGLETTSPKMLPEATSDGDGRFAIVGLGRDRLVGLRIMGPHITTSLLHVATVRMKPLQIRLKLGPPRRFYGAQFEFVAEPSVPLEGTVKDEESGVPIAGAIVASYRFNGEMNLTDTDGLVFTTSDAEGRFKLEGLPVSDKNSVRIVPPDLPYLAAEDLSVTRGNPSRPVLQDIKLRRCVWAAGRVRDVKTGKPAIGQMFYTPFHSNEFAKLYSRYQKGFQNGLEQHPAGRTDKEGRFRIPVIPGRGVLCFRNENYQEHYRPGNGASAIKELAKAKRNRKRVGPTFDDVRPQSFQAVCEINPPADAKQIDVDVPVDSGQDVVLKFVDGPGNRLTGLRTMSWGLDVDLLPNDAGSDRAIVRATSPGETRLVWIKHAATGLTKLLHFTAKPGESERTITLELPAVLTGRLMSADGHPLAGRSINCMIASEGNSTSGVRGIETDAGGRFRCEVPGGGPFELYTHVVGYGGFASLARNLTVQSGERVDFGELVVNISDDSMIRVTAKYSPQRTLSPAAAP